MLVRLATTVPVLWGISVVVFSLVRFIPGDPSHAILLSMVDPGADLSSLEQDLARLRADLGLDRPYLTQYADWLGNVLAGNLGTSLRSGDPVTDELWRRLPATLELAGAALVVMVVVAVPTGIVGAARHGAAADRLARMLALVGVSVPGFLLGLLLMYGFSVHLGWLPTSGHGTPAHLVLPAVTLGLGLAAGTSRLLRAGLLDALSQPYMVTAEAKGLPWRQMLLRHALRNALLPVLTNTGLIVGGLFGGAVIVETVFSWPGIGRYIVDAITGRDYPVIQAFVLAMSLMYGLVNLVVDIGYRFADPRVRVEGAEA
ncbi:nickel ABC transporter permease [Planosporangium flavigriseum]|uniref:Nickel import system permease protein NikB n=1 Tax=Planosporangium flavigriseum TaxID=373681 RepID=A0A8J3PPI7_9ACTN|nr:nickel ABC transporter permease [Planosporangium flavigriseum]GIG76414.1 peptide ABC transporter permease [Planosporangium flavigriseum]